jgi:rfaE bifunctional protein nucleotidyltransferase chain/domain
MSFHDLLNSKVAAPIEVSRIIEGLRLKGRKIVFTNGCFDILHQGHVECLSKARDLGNFLIVGLNSDASVKKLNKGDDRPVNNENSRAKVLASLGMVDAVVIFGEDTPIELIKLFRPNVLVKGGDYKAEEIVGYKEVKASGGEVVIIPFVEGFSTTKTIGKMK